MSSIGMFLYIVAFVSIFPYLEGYGFDDIEYFLERSGIQKTQFNMNKARNGRMMLTDLDDYRGIMVLFRLFLLKSVASKWDQLMEYNRKMGKLQKPHPKWEEFPCKLNNTRSTEPPKTVHELRPGDIDVIAAMGDSISAGNGLMSKYLFSSAMEFRGLAFSGGGIEDWRTILTLPNILKVFNPKLYGFATGKVLTVSRKSHLNIAEPMIMSQDLLYQAHIFIARLKKDPHVDFKNHWKLLTIFVGNNDICSDMCHYDDITVFLKNHERDLIDAFTLLRNNVPRLVINLMPVPNMVTTLFSQKNISPFCRTVYTAGCHCIFSHSYDPRSIRRANNYIKRWQAIDQYVAELPEFQTDDFIVLYQPITENISVPTVAGGGMDFRYFSEDCFHFSQLGHAAISNALWNNMLQPKSKKQAKVIKPFVQFECPTEDKPFIATGKNSIE